MKRYILLLISFCCIKIIFAQDSTSNNIKLVKPSFFDLSIEDIMNIKVTSVSKRTERSQDVASSIYVINQDMIEQSGATRIQDLLNMIPGVFFQFENYTHSSLGLREAADAFSGSVLVLIDNVPLQSPLYSTFQWQNFDFNLSEIDRIEVIKGPGGTIYGANATTGIINIYTKEAKDSQGMSASLQTGTNGLIIPSLRYGTKLDKNHSISVYGKGHFFNGFNPVEELNGNNVKIPIHDINGNKTGDSTIKNNLNNDVYRTDRLTMGVRTYSKFNDKTKLTTSIYVSKNKHQEYTYLQSQERFSLIENSFTNFFGTARIDRRFNDNHSFFMQYSTSGFKSIASNGNNLVTTDNLELQNNFEIGINQVSVGINGRKVDFRTSDVDTLNSDLQFTDPNTSKLLVGAFLQNKILFSEKIDLTMGIKGEIWTLIDTKPEWSPSVRFTYKPNKALTFWGAASRSVTTPGFIQTNIELTIKPSFDVNPNLTIPRIILTNGDDIDQSEYLTFEAGIKGGRDKISYDVSGFYTITDRLIGLTIPENLADPSIQIKSKINKNETVIPYFYANNGSGVNYGGEGVLRYIPSSNFTAEISYSYFKTEKKTKGIMNRRDNPETPEHTIGARVYFSLGNNYTLSLNSLFMSKFGSNKFLYLEQKPPELGMDDEAYTLHEIKEKYRLDFKLEKRFDKNTSAYLWGMDMLNFGTIQEYNGFTTGIPYQTHLLVGIGTNLNF